MTIAIPALHRVPAAERGITIGDFLIPVRFGERISPRLRDIALVVAGAMLIALSSLIRIPVPGSPVPITGQTFAVLLVGGALGYRRGTLAALGYLLIGFFVPVYSGGASGPDTILSVKNGTIVLGATGGYLVGFVFASALVGRLAELGWDRRIGGAIAAMSLGNLVIYAFGVPWLMAATGFSVQEAIAKGLTPFLIGDAIKLLLAAAAFPMAWWVVGRRPGER
jgi:biotin transport system substrate-specific component